MLIFNLLRLKTRTLTTNNFVKYSAQSENLNLEKLEKEGDQLDVFDEDQRLREEELERKRNKSRLREHDRNRLFNKVPYEEPKLWLHGTLKYQRKIFGKYGESSNVNPALCWPTKEELADNMEYERVAYPFTIPEMIDKAHAEKEKRKAAVRARDLEIQEKMKKLNGWVKEMKDKMRKKEEEALAAKERKEKLIEEVRRYFGYTIDPRDERFKEMLEKKEKEQKKVMKEARKKAKEAKLLEKLSAAKVETKSAVTEDNDNTKSN